MKKATVYLALVSLLSTAPIAGASHNSHDHSPNVRQVSTTQLQWGATQDPNAIRAPMYVYDFAFQGDRVFGGVAGGHAPVRHQGEVPESGLAVFGLKREGDVARQLGRMKCKTTSDVSVWGNLVFQGSLEDQESSTTGTPSDECDRDGLRIIDVSDPSGPFEAAFVSVPCGVGEHALVPHGDSLYLYNPSSCDESVDNPFGAGVTSEMSVLSIDRTHPKRSRIASIGDIFPMTGCSEVAVHLSRDLGVCLGDRRFILFDISDPPNPQAISDSLRVLEHNIWSVAFSWDGSLLAVGTSPRVNQQTAFTLFDIEDPTNPVVVGTWTPPEIEAIDVLPYSLSFLPMRDGRQILVVALAALGVRIVDVTDPSRPTEIGYYNAYDPHTATAENPWGNANAIAAYWYNGRFYASDFGRVRVFRVKGFDRRTVHYFKGRFNPQTQIERFQQLDR